MATWRKSSEGLSSVWTRDPYRIRSLCGRPPFYLYRELQYVGQYDMLQAAQADADGGAQPPAPPPPPPEESVPQQQEKKMRLSSEDVLQKVDVAKSKRRKGSKGLKELQRLANHQGKTIGDLRKLEWFRAYRYRLDRDVEEGAVTIKPNSTTGE